MRQEGRAQGVVVAVGALAGPRPVGVVILVVIVMVVVVGMKHVQQGQELPVAALVALVRRPEPCRCRPRGLSGCETLGEKPIQTIIPTPLVVVVIPGQQVGVALLEACAEGDVWLYGRTVALGAVAHVGQEVLVETVERGGDMG